MTSAIQDITEKTVLTTSPVDGPRPTPSDPKPARTREDRGVRLSRAECDEYAYELAEFVGFVNGYRAAKDDPAAVLPPETTRIDELRRLLKEGRG